MVRGERVVNVVIALGQGRTTGWRRTNRWREEILISVSYSSSNQQKKEEDDDDDDDDNDYDDDDDDDDDDGPTYGWGMMPNKRTETTAPVSRATNICSMLILPLYIIMYNV